MEIIAKDDHAAIEEAVRNYWPEALSRDCVFHLLQNLAKKPKGFWQKYVILRDASWLFQAQNAGEFQKWAALFRKKYARIINLPALKYFVSKWHGATRFYALEPRFWPAAKTTNRLERLFGELRRRIRAFRRFPNTLSC